MQSIQESQMEDRSFRKRQNMLSDIQAMILDYKKKSNYSNLVTQHEEIDENGLALTSEKEQPMRLAQTSKTDNAFSTQEIPVPQSRLTYRTGDSFDVSVTSRSQSRSRDLSRSMSRSGSRPRARVRDGSSSRRKAVIKRSPFAPSRSKGNRSIDSRSEAYDVIY